MRLSIIGAIASIAARTTNGLDRFHIATDVDSFSANLKETYDPIIRSQLAEDNIAESFMRTDTETERWDGKVRKISVKLGRNFAAGSIGAGGRLPQAGRGVWKQFQIPARDTYTRVGFERYILEQAKKKGMGAVADVVTAEVEGAYDDLLFVRNRMMFGYGSGILALVNGAQAAETTIEVDSPGNIAGSFGGNRYLNGSDDSGQYIAFINGAGVVQGTATVVGVSDDGNSIDVDTPITCDDNCKIVLAQTPEQNSLNKEPEGLLAGIDDGTLVDDYHDLSRTTYPILKSTVITGVGAFSGDAIQQGIDMQAVRRGKGIDFFFTEFNVRRAYLATLDNDRRYTGADLSSPDGGTTAAKNPNPKVGANSKAITYGDLPMFADRDHPYGWMEGVRKDSWTRFVLSEGEWDATDGREMKWVPETDQWTMFWHQLDNFHCQSPNQNIRWEDIDTDAVFVHPH